ncbi:protein of unknown function [Maridesulfovibrio hydrothermalis AM13 = DSM 14728]|uniref:Uncharacterized protein n=1 Tax=Maridesulfovibrio hydrothermalis AM13 = DSM 14728 TaxID=1121451 RepID=L0REM5_9BACT|nr:protein of unknown function [Maridesulfovibrio hydrothermalis AM13 = DSM 14728]
MKSKKIFNPYKIEAMKKYKPTVTILKKPEISSIISS